MYVGNRTDIQRCPVIHRYIIICSDVEVDHTECQWRGIALNTILACLLPLLFQKLLSLHCEHFTVL